MVGERGEHRFANTRKVGRGAVQLGILKIGEFGLGARLGGGGGGFACSHLRHRTTLTRFNETQWEYKRCSRGSDQVRKAEDRGR